MLEKQNENHATAEAEKLAAHFEELKVKMEGANSDSENAQKDEAVNEEPADESPTHGKMEFLN